MKLKDFRRCMNCPETKGIAIRTLGGNNFTGQKFVLCDKCCAMLLRYGRSADPKERKVYADVTGIFLRELSKGDKGLFKFSEYGVLP